MIIIRKPELKDEEKFLAAMQRSVQLHYPSHHWKGKIALRDYLLAHPDVAKEYELLKQHLSRQHQYDRERYTDEKSNFITNILDQLNRGFQ